MRRAALLCSVLLLAACQRAAPQMTPFAPPPVVAASPTPAPPAPAGIPQVAAPVAGSPTPPPAARISAQDGMPQVFVPPGRLRMGGLDVHADQDELPPHDVDLPAYWIDQLEVTNAMYLLCVQAGACTPPAGWTSETRLAYFNEETYKDYPVVQVAWEQAAAYCAWAGRQLPTEAEWERAARGDDLRTFPWGDEPPGERYANYARLVGDTSRVGSYAAGASPFGALDMAGNVWEWTADYFNPRYYLVSEAVNPAGPPSSTTYLRVIRGGSFQDEWIDIRVSKRGSALGPNPDAPFDAPGRDGESSSRIGFRCAQQAAE